MASWHLEYTFEADEALRIMYVKIYGVWRVPTAEAYLEDFKTEVEPLIEHPWAKIIDLSNWKTAYPEVVRIIGDLNRWCRSNNMAWAVYVINNRVTQAQLVKMIENGDYKDISRIVRTRSEGEQFLIKKGFGEAAPSGDTSLFK